MAKNTIQFSSRAWSGGFTQVPNHVLEAPHLTGGAKLTFALLLKFGWQEGASYPGQKKMAGFVGCTEKTLRVYIDELKSIGLVEVQRRGQGMTNRYVLHPERSLVPPGSVTTTVPEGSPTTDKEDSGEEDSEKKTGQPPSAAPSDCQKLYESYVEIVRDGKLGRLPETIPSGYLKDAKAALADWPMDSLVIALRGFRNYRARKPGGDRFSDVFGTHISQSRTERIEFWISQADGASRLHSFPSETRAKIVRSVKDVQRAFGSRDPDLLATGEQALSFLRSLGIENVPKQDGRPDFPSLRSES